MKKYLNLLFILPVFLFIPLIVFGCEGDLLNLPPLSPIFLLYFIITSIIYFKNYKKLIDEKWNLWQYIVVLLITIPSLLLVWDILITIPVPSILREEAIPGSMLPNSRHLNENLFTPILTVVAFFVVLFPLIFKKGWIYKWGIPLYILIIFSLYLLVNMMFVSYLC